MACVMYWTMCECGYETYDRMREMSCLSCGSEKVKHVRECDEDDDIREERDEEE